MKVLQISNKIPFKAKDGGSLAVYNLFKGFYDFEIEVHVLSMSTSKHKLDLEEIKDELPDRIKYYQVHIDTSINLISLLLNLFFKKTPYILERFISEEFHYEIKRLVLTYNYDIVQLEGLYLCPYIDTVKEHSNSLIAYRSHNIESDIWMKNADYEKNYLKRFYLKKLSKRLRNYEKNIINKYDLLVPISLKDLEFFVKYGNKKPVYTAPFGIDPDLYPFKNNYNESDEITIFYIGSLDWIPNIEGLKWFIVSVWAKIKEQYPGIVFRVAGRNPVRSVVKLMKKYDIEFVGEISDSQKYFLDNTIMVVPLFSGSGMRVKIIEGMAYGKTIVSTKKGAEGIDYTEGENIIIAESAKDFIQQICKLIKNPNILNEMGSSARNLIESNYNYNLISSQLILFYQQHLS